MYRSALGLLVFCVATSAVSAGASFGELPSGAVSTNVVEDVRAEVCRDHLFDPSLIQTRLPTGYRLILGAEYAKDDPAVARLVATGSRYSAYAVGSLCFVSVGRFIVDGKPIESDGRIAMAFWWARAAGPRDPRMRGAVEWLQLASWYSQDLRDRTSVIVADPMAQFADLEVEEVEPNLWRMRLVLPGESIEAEVRGSGQRTRRNKLEPGFMSVAFTGDSADAFWVITYFGHHHQSAEGQWHATGSGVFTDALRIPGEAAVFGTFFQDGWSALSGLYRQGP